MKVHPLLAVVAALLWSYIPARAADPVVSNLTATQRAGTKLVDITYDVSADTPTVQVTLEISSDGGATYAVPVAAVTGAVGNEVAIGTAKTITWDAGVDLDGQYTPQTRFRVMADDLLLQGFSHVAPGTLPVSSWAGAQSVAAFYISKTEVTWSEWQAVRTWAAANGYDSSYGMGNGPNHPVRNVDWYRVLKWCNARSESEGLTAVYRVGIEVYRSGDSVPTVDTGANGYRLPSEKEWEFAARGGVQTNGFEFSGSNNVDAVAWYWTNSGSSGSTTHDVGIKEPNELGLFDMSGNVWEFCFDVFSGARRVIRGGSYNALSGQCLVGDRINSSAPYSSSPNVGFRVVRSSARVGAATNDVVVNTGSWTLSSLPAVGGNLAGAGSFGIGDPATLTASPDPGYIFSSWTGDASGSVNPLTLGMDSNKTVGATFAPDFSDADTDGLSAYLEATIYGTDPTKADTDGDGLTDAWEVGRGRVSIVAGNFTWAQARTDAQTRGGDLASFPDENRWNRALETLGADALDDYTGLWIGSSDAAADGTWTWVNGEAFLFQQWAATRPSSAVGNTLDYAEVSGGAGAEIGKWYDRSPTTVRDGYLLETGYATNPNVADADGDGLNDSQEQTAGTNPFLADTDGDGLNDGQEVNLTHTNPKLSDSDGDGLNDAADDQDGDTLSNLAEITVHGTDPRKTDTDGDGLSDSAELSHPASYFALVQGSFTYAQATADAAAKRGRVASFPNANDYSRTASKARQSTQGYLWIGLSDVTTEGTWLWTNGSTATYDRWLAGQPSGGATENHVVIMESTTQWADTTEAFTAAGYLFERVGLDPLDPDTDGDDLSDGREVNTTGSNPVLEDTDGDGLSDGAEVDTHGSSPLMSDTDADGLSDRAEVEVHQSNPSAKDTDGDGFEDLFEVNTGFNPAINTSTPDAISSIRTAVEFRFNAANGVSYRIEASTDLNEWNTIETNILGASAVVTRFYSIENQPKRYFRVRRN